MKPRIAVIGAGISGLTLARELSASGQITVFEKARGAGGRMSTRRADPYAFDHGAPFFTARTPEFQAFLAPYLRRGVISEWTGRHARYVCGKLTLADAPQEPYYTGTLGMSALCKALAEGLDMRYGCEIAPLTDTEPQGRPLFDKEGTGLGAFDWIISSAPPAQTERLFDRFLPLDAPLRTARMQGCYALMLGFARSLPLEFVTAEIDEGPLSRISINSSKPGRACEGLTSVTALSSHAWAEEHMENEAASVQDQLSEAFTHITDVDAATANYVSVHRWRYAAVTEGSVRAAYLTPELRLAACGDWCEASRIESAWTQAHKLAAELALTL